MASPLHTTALRLLLPATAMLLASAVPMSAQHAHAARLLQPAGDSAAVAATVKRFHAALATGDSATAMALLSPDAIVLESGDVESRAVYGSHHLPADIEFTRAVPSRTGPVRVRVRGEAAWASSTSSTRGTFRGRPVNSAGVELMVLVREGGGWLISAIHWSSHRVQP